MLLVVAAAVSVLVYLAATKFAAGVLDEFLLDRRQDLYGAIVGVHTTMLGFVLATLTVVLSYAQSPRFEVLRASGWMPALFSVFTNALWVFSFAFVLAFAALLFDQDEHPVDLLAALVAGSTVSAIAGLGHLLLVLAKVVPIITSSAARPPGA